MPNKILAQARELSQVQINIPQIQTIAGSNAIGLSALAYDQSNQPIWSGASYNMKRPAFHISVFKCPCASLLLYSRVILTFFY